MKSVLLTTLLFLGLSAPMAWAQQPSTTFSALPQILKTGQTVIVRPEGRRAVRGDVVFVSDSEIVVAPRFLFTGFLLPKRSFAKETIRSIDVVDPTWDGAVKSVAVATGVLALSCAFECERGEAGYLPLLVLAVAIPSGIVGHTIDLMINRTVFERPPQLSRVAVTPMAGRERLNVTARITF